eukprot:245687-Heterocapsa_arctica.AAC.1
MALGGRNATIKHNKTTTTKTKLFLIVYYTILYYYKLQVRRRHSAAVPRQLAIAGQAETMERCWMPGV